MHGYLACRLGTWCCHRWRLPGNGGSTGNNATYGGCNLVVSFNTNGSINTFAPAGATNNYDGSDDALIGVVNNSGHSISSFFISNPSLLHGGIYRRHGQ
mgnify:FL=1